MMFRIHLCNSSIFEGLSKPGVKKLRIFWPDPLQTGTTVTTTSTTLSTTTFTSTSQTITTTVTTTETTTSVSSTTRSSNVGGMDVWRKVVWIGCLLILWSRGDVYIYTYIYIYYIYISNKLLQLGYIAPLHHCQTLQYLRSLFQWPTTDRFVWWSMCNLFVL